MTEPHSTRGACRTLLCAAPPPNPVCTPPCPPPSVSPCNGHAPQASPSQASPPAPPQPSSRSESFPCPPRSVSTLHPPPSSGHPASQASSVLIRGALKVRMGHGRGGCLSEGEVGLFCCKGGTIGREKG
ncbi:hypothetical protein EDD18DRAFT_1365453 [Armillaria luteobubalina]|uniref:Uncharacterized protein n=1 Tax=Armillaria luteobubalina TaxID=153913 RepID=A0AA39P4K0_9AGAR|nr:hypothetical protein EDD18DRAFT_1365453 [Armillaria luteobubalina]